MIKIVFKRLKIKDFQGLRNFEIEFDDILTKIKGENGTGKTTILDSLYWLFFDKNSSGKSKFDLIPLDSDNNVIKGAEPTVELDLELDDNLINLRKVKSKSNTYFIDEVPKKASEFSEYISSIISEKLFMTLINPVFFGNNYEWSEQKSIILDNFDVEDTVINLPKYTSIKTDIVSFGVDDVKKKYDAKRKELEKEITRDNGTKEYITSNLKNKKIDESKENLITQKELINKQIEEYDKSFSKVYDLKDQLAEINNKIQKLNNEKTIIIANKKNEINQKKNEKDTLLRNYKTMSSDLKSIEDTCPSCGSKLNPQKIQEQKDALQTKVNSIVSEGKILQSEIEVLELELCRLTKEENIDAKLLSSKESIEKEIITIQNIANLDKIGLLKKQVSELDEKISSYDLINKLNKDLEEVNSRINSNTDQLDDVEIKLNLIKEYHKDYSQLVADELNSKLENVKIKTFSVQKNGDIKETFEITMNGVPYSSLNSAGKIIAGVELIQLIKDALDINFPIIIDNKESITKDFDVDNQIITLEVVKGAKLGV